MLRRAELGPLIPARGRDGQLRGLLVAQAVLLVFLIVVGAALGLAGSRQGWEAIGLAWAVVMLLYLHRRAGWRQLFRVSLEYGVVGLLMVAALTAPGVRPEAPKQAVKPAQAAQALDLAKGCGEFRLNIKWARCVWDRASDKAKALSPTTTTTPRRRT